MQYFFACCMEPSAYCTELRNRVHQNSFRVGKRKVWQPCSHQQQLRNEKNDDTGVRFAV